MKVIGIMVGVHFIVIAVIYLSFRAVSTAGKKYDVEKLHYMLYVQRESLEKFIGQERELYRLRHELEHKLFTVQYLFEKNQMEEGFCVLKQIIVELCGDAKNISVSQNIVETVIENIQKKYEAEKVRIEKEILFPDETIMELVDLCILLGDLLDNAMEAAAGSEEKQVKISVREEFNCLYLKIANSFSERHSDVKTFVSKKEEGGHGFGMRNIREIVKRYGGELMIYDEKGWFYAAVIIYGQK
ncbi:MAG: GHKL domain-containing protein [Lachnospiraceae bacterium]|nr:GHKL domain-containing protein [Lachnospiraceae bacterium]